VPDPGAVTVEEQQEQLGTTLAAAIPPLSLRT
jgi:hypothetical protein